MKSLRSVFVYGIMVVIVLFAGHIRANNYFVTNTNDSGAGSLRQAMTDAENHAGTDSIHFNVPVTDPGYNSGLGVWTIQPASALPVLYDDGTIIDGTTQRNFIGWDANPSGPEIVLDGSVSGAYSGLDLNGSYCVIRELVIHRFTSYQIYITGNFNHVAGCYIGPDPTGSFRASPSGMGIRIYFGTHNIIGGIAEEDRNVISGNGQEGIYLSYDANYNEIIGNYIGLTGTGTDTLGNTYDGIAVGYYVKGNIIGPANVISGNHGTGIYMAGENCDSTHVLGNKIGTDKTGTIALGNDYSGIYIDYHARYSIIGGLNPGDGNLISGNGTGISLYYEVTDYHQILGNFIGTDESGMYPLGNRYNGISISGGPQNNTIGPKNIIAFNGQDGIDISGTGTTGNTITQNSIHSNAGLGIDNNSGGNLELFAPEITELSSVTGTAPANSVVEIFSGPDEEGMNHEYTVTADGAGNFYWAGSPLGFWVTATATDAAGNTSEFSVPKHAGSFMVTTTQDTGEGSLRWAIELANQAQGPDTIQFNIPESDGGFDGTVWTIRPQSQLPQFTDSATVIDGFSQSGNQRDSNADGPEIMLNGREAGWASGFVVGSSGNVISGLIISGFRYDGISFQGSVVHDNKVLGNYIGTNAAGTDTLGNDYGISLYEEINHTIIGGTGEFERNIISGNKYNGIYICDSDSNVVAGNYIGTDKTGTLKVANGNVGIILLGDSEGNRIGDSGEERNLISGNVGSGIQISGMNVRNNAIVNNFIGTDVTGAQNLGNTSTGIYMNQGVGNIIGGTLSGESNVISGNTAYGIFLIGAGTDSNQFTGNYIGTDLTGTIRLPNNYGGVEIYNGPKYNQIGPGNVIRFNGNYGVHISRSSSRYNRITQNSISGNLGKGIYLYDKGNGEFEKPVITGVGSVEGTAPPNSIVEIFSDSTDQGRIYHDFITADGSGHFYWAGTPAGPFVTATATSDSGNTSEFSEPKLAVPLTVTNTQDQGWGSLRWAIEFANNSSGPDTIRFDIPASDPGFDGTVWTITPQSIFPAITSSGTVIDGNTQTTNQGNYNVGPEIMLNGNAITGYYEGIVLNSSNNLIAGLIISGFPGAGILVNTSGARYNTIRGNYIGTNPSGTDTLCNDHGIYITGGAAHTTVGGTIEAHRNIISGNKSNGIYIYNSDSNTVIGNYIGIDRTGSTAVTNGNNGIYLGYLSNQNVIGGSTIQERNIISGNNYRGIYISSDSNSVKGCFVGTDAAGTTSVPNEWSGIYLGGGRNAIGGTTAGEGNVISGNSGTGLLIAGDNADSNQVAGNFIGTDLNEQTNLGNHIHGIEIYSNASNNTIGPFNRIRFNQSHGIRISGSSTRYNRITQNSISNNQNLGIFLTSNGNGEIAKPVITTVGSVEGTTFPNATVEIFSDSSGQGRIYETTRTADGSGNFSWAGSPVGPYVTATATDDSGNTSEFSNPKRLGDLVVINTQSSGFGSLKWAIEQSNINIGPDSIIFDIPTSDPGYDGTVWTIALTEELPAISDDGTVIDATTQTQNQGNRNTAGPEVMLDGRGLTTSYDGFEMWSSNNVIAGFIISGFKGDGIEIYSPAKTGNVIRGNYIGTNAAGDDTLGNFRGIYIYNVNGSIIGGAAKKDRNVISGNHSDGLYMAYADSSLVIGNFIGLNASGTGMLPNEGDGIDLRYTSVYNQIGGGTPGERNIISGNLNYGIRLYGAGARENRIQGNYIGTDSTGQADFGNQYYGIGIYSIASSNLIGGSGEGEGNLISGNGWDGLSISGAGTDSNQVAGNRIGTNASGIHRIPNDDNGVRLSYKTKYNIIGPGNLVSGNNDIGIVINGDSTYFNSVKGNWVGLDATSQDTIPNHQHGIRVESGARYNTIGGLTAADRNIVSGNGWSGLATAGDSTGYNLFQNNYCGTDTSGTMDLGNIYHGAHFGGIGNTFRDNLFSGNDGNGMRISNFSQDILIENNLIGVQANSVDSLPNGENGIYVEGYAEDNTIGPDNTIRFNKEFGIELTGATVKRITMTQNSIAYNRWGGISLINSANEGIAAPVITGKNPLRGTAPASSLVEIYSDSSTQGRIYEGYTTADGSGNWSYAFSITGPYATVTATDGQGNTSAFSDSLFTSVKELPGNQIPKHFFLSQNYPNPFNPITTIRFGVKESCKVVLKLYNLLGHEVITLTDKAYKAGEYEVQFDASRFASGIYIYTIEMKHFRAVRKMMLLK